MIGKFLLADKKAYSRETRHNTGAFTSVFLFNSKGGDADKKFYCRLAG
jgi:hypothetical protein